jgi:MFS family permease
MTQARERPPAAGRFPGPYLEVLRLPGALRFSAAGFLARMPMSMFGLGTVLLIAAVTGRYGVAGTVAAAGSMGYAVTAPQCGKLADRFGQRRVLRPQVALFALATVALMVLAEGRAPLPAVAAAGLLAGATMPSMGSMVRARWSALVATAGPADGEGQLHTAFSLESVADEVIFVVGPAVVTLLATDVYPAAGVGTAMLAGLAGTLLFTAQRATEPAPTPQPAAARRAGLAGAARPRAAWRASLATVTWALARRAGPAAVTRALAARLAAPSLLPLVPVYWLLGAMFGAVDLSTVAFSAEQGHKALAGAVLAVYALGSAVGGLWYGSRPWRAPLPLRFTLTLACMTAGVAVLWLQPNLAALSAMIFLAGLGTAPTLIAGYSLLEHQAPRARRTEGMTWLSSAISVGVACASPLAGHLIDSHGARWGYLLAAVSGLAAFAACLAGLPALRSPSR